MHSVALKKTHFPSSGKNVIACIPHLISYIITWLHPFNVEKIELFVIFHMMFH